MVFPVVLGSGRRLFPDDATDKAPLKLVGTTTFDSGVAVHTYRPVPPEGSADRQRPCPGERLGW